LNPVLRTWKLASALLLAAVLALPAAQLLAQAVPPDLFEVSVERPETAPPGGYTPLVVGIAIHHQWHVNANPPTEDFLVPTEVVLELPEGVTAGEPQYPQGKSLPFGFSDVPLDVYEGRIEIPVPLTVSEAVAPGEYPLTGEVRFQACNDQLCLAPDSRTFETVLVVDAAAPLRTAAPAVSGDGNISTAPPPDAETGAAGLARKFEENVLLAFFLVFLSGLALNLTPCVYPMISVTLAIFGAREEKRLSKRLPPAIVYVLGIAFMYSALGLLAAFTGTLFGAFLQHPAVLIGIGVVLGAMALSMFGLYEIQVPSSVLSKMGGQTTAGLVGIFLSGLLVGVFAAPCIGPFILALLAVVTQSGNPWFGFWAFFVMSLGLGAPYLLLATFSGLLQSLPRSGTWMEWVKRVFGVLLIAVAVFYVSLAFAADWSEWVVPVTLIVGGIYLGFLERSGNESRPFAWTKRALGVVAVVLGIMWLPLSTEPGVKWEPYAAERLEAARAEGKPVILDFYATWCIPCKELDHQTFTDPEVMKLADQFTTLKVDLTHFDSPEAKGLREKFGVAGVPTIIFLGADGTEVAGTRVVGFVGPEVFARLGRKALPGNLSAIQAVP
jgi:thiol:disulfide interchange protein DsbD